MTNSKLEEALDAFDARATGEAKRQRDAALAAAHSKAYFDRYRAETLLPTLNGLSSQLTARGHHVEIISSDDLNNPLLDANFIEMRFKSAGSTQDTLGASVIFAQKKNVITVITNATRPQNLRLELQVGKPFNPEADSAEDVVVEFLKSVLV